MRRVYMFTMGNDTVRRTRPDSVIERTAGVLKRELPPMSAKKMRELVEWAIADEAFERMNR